MVGVRKVLGASVYENNRFTTSVAIGAHRTTQRCRLHIGTLKTTCSPDWETSALALNTFHITPFSRPRQWQPYITIAVTIVSLIATSSRGQTTWLVRSWAPWCVHWHSLALSGQSGGAVTVPDRWGTAHWATRSMHSTSSGKYTLTTRLALAQTQHGPSWGNFVLVWGSMDSAANRRAE